MVANGEKTTILKDIEEILQGYWVYGPKRYICYINLYIHVSIINQYPLNNT